MKKILIIALFLMAALGSAKRMRAQVVVIANPSVKSADISRNDLRDVFTGITSNLKDGSHVVPVLLKDGPTNEAFLHDYVEKSDTAYRAGWRSMVFSGETTMPKTLDGDAAVVAFVAHNPGAIGYVVKSTPHEGVKVLTVK